MDEVTVDLIYQLPVGSEGAVTMGGLHLEECTYLLRDDLLSCICQGRLRVVVTLDEEPIVVSALRLLDDLSQQTTVSRDVAGSQRIGSSGL